MHLNMTLELIPQLEPIPTWNRLYQWLFWPMESLWNQLQKNWNRNISTREWSTLTKKKSLIVYPLVSLYISSQARNGSLSTLPSLKPLSAPFSLRPDSDMHSAADAAAPYDPE